MGGEFPVARVLEYARGLEDVDVGAIRDGLVLYHLHRYMQLRMERSYEAVGMSPRRFDTLEALYHEPGHTMTPAELADQVQLSRAAMTGNLDSLQRRGYVRRRPHPDDRRMVFIELTDEGKAAMEQLLPRHYRTLSRVICVLGPEERRMLEGFYRRVAAKLDEILEQSDQPAAPALDGAPWPGGSLAG